MTFIGLDLGTSFIKGARLDVEHLSLGHPLRVPFPAPLNGLPPLYREYDPGMILSSVRALLDDLLSDGPDCEGVLLCSQMHGLVLVGPRGQPHSNLITWQDQRVLMEHPTGGQTYFDVAARRIGPDAIRQLGNELCPGLPVGTLFWLAEQGLLYGGLIPAALPDFVVASLCDSRPVTESTHAMSHGVLNLETMTWHAPVISALGLESLQWPPVLAHGSVCGYLTVGGRQVPCFTPVGDFQCALLGALLQPGELSLNISTGSQASLLLPRLSFGNFQTRPFFDNRFLATVTHIPAGRSLDALVRLLLELAEAQHVRLEDPWEYITRAAAGVENTGLRVNLAFFNSSCGDHGEISHIRESELTVGHVFRAAFENMADHYYAKATQISPERAWNRLVFSGGLAHKIELLRTMIAQKFQMPYRMSPSSEDTLLGLLALALVFSGRAPDVQAAIQAIKELKDR